MLSAEEYLKYGTFMCYYYYKLYGVDCENHCPLGLKGRYEKNSFCVFPDLQTLENGYFHFDFAIKTVEEFKNEISDTKSLVDIFLEKFPNCCIDVISRRHCPLIYFQDIYKCNLECKNETKAKTKEDCWYNKITIENEEFKKFIDKLETRK